MNETTLAKSETGTEVARPELTRDTITFTPRVDIYETDEQLVLTADLPGVTPEDLDIRFENRELTVHGKVTRNEGTEYLYSEYGIGDFRRAFAIGDSIDAEKINAELTNGVLTLHLPKTDAVRPRRIEVRNG